MNEIANDSARVSGQDNKIPCPQEKSEEPSPIFPKLKTKLFSELKESKAALGIPNKLIKIAAQPLAKPFAYIFNECIFTGVVPDVLKWSQVTPVHKNGPTTDPTNYRQIAILSPFSKVLEKLVYDQLYSFLEKMKSSINISLDLGKTFPLNKPYLN